jgi:uncharacterized protein involved in exopolysaccharide biosynthesis
VDRATLLTRGLWAQRAALSRWAVAGVAAGVILAFGSTTEYSSSTKLVPYMRQADASGLQGLAGLAGVRLPTGVSEQVLTADLYPEVAQSLDFRVQVAETPIGFAGLGRSMTPISYFDSEYRPGLIATVAEYTLGLPRLLMAALRPTGDTQLFSGDTLQLRSFPKVLRDALDEMEERLSVSIDRKTGIVTLRGTMPDAYASAALVTTASQRLMERIIDYQSQKADEEYRFVQEQYGQARERFERAQVALATLTDRNRRTLTATSQVEAQRVQAEYELALTVYRQLSSELEQARMRVNRDTPVFTVLEHAVVPDKRSSPRRGLVVFSCVALALLLGAGRVLWKQWQTPAPETSSTA